MTIGANDFGGTGQNGMLYEPVRAIGGHVEGAASWGVARDDVYPWNSSWNVGAGNPVSSGTVKRLGAVAVSVGWVMRPAAFVDQGFGQQNDATFTETVLWLGPDLPGSAGPWDGADVTPTPSPSPTPSASPTATPTPPPPGGGYAPPLATPTPGPNLGGSGGLNPPNPNPPNPTGLAACDADDGTYSKPGQAALQPLSSTAFPGSVNPLDYIPWVGNMLANIPIVISNVRQEAINEGIDFVIPGPCLATVIEDRLDAIRAEPPFSLFDEVNEALSGASTGSVALAIPLPGGTVADFPFDSLTAAAPTVRPVLVAVVYFVTALMIGSLIAGTFGVKGTGE
jgi:hypothetical protein